MQIQITFLEVSLSCLSNSRTMAQCQRCRVSGATGGSDYRPTLHEWNKNWQSNSKTTEYHSRNLDCSCSSRHRLPKPPPGREDVVSLLQSPPSDEDKKPTDWLGTAWSKFLRR